MERERDRGREREREEGVGHAHVLHKCLSILKGLGKKRVAGAHLFLKGGSALVRPFLELRAGDGLGVSKPFLGHRVGLPLRSRCRR